VIVAYCEWKSYGAYRRPASAGLISGGGPLPLINAALVGTENWRELIIRGAPIGVE